MVMMNYIELQEDRPLRMHFSDHYWIEQMIFDRDAQKELPKRKLVFQVDRLEGEPEIRTFSILSSKLVVKLEPYLKDSRHRDYEFIITKRGSGFQTEYEVEVLPLSPDSLF